MRETALVMLLIKVEMTMDYLEKIWKTGLLNLELEAEFIYGFRDNAQEETRYEMIKQNANHDWWLINQNLSIASLNEENVWSSFMDTSSSCAASLKY